MASFTHIPGTTGGTSYKFVPQVWSKEAQIQRESKLFMAKRIDRFDVDFASGGDVLNIPKVTDLTASAIGNDGSLAEQANTEGSVTLTVDQWMGVVINVPDLLKAQSRYDLMRLYTEKMGYALGKVIETAILTGMYNGATNTAGTGGTDLTDAALRNGVEDLDLALVPFEDRHAVIYPTQKNALLGIDKFVRYDSIAYASGQSPVKTGSIGELYGLEFMVSPLISTISGARANLMWHRSAYGLALVKDIKVEQFARTQFSDRLGSSELYGSATTRADHAVQLKS